MFLIFFNTLAVLVVSVQNGGIILKDTIVVINANKLSFTSYIIA